MDDCPSHVGLLIHNRLRPLYGFTARSRNNDLYHSATIFGFRCAYHFSDMGPSPVSWPLFHYCVMWVDVISDFESPEGYDTPFSEQKRQRVHHQQTSRHSCETQI